MGACFGFVILHDKAFSDNLETLWRRSGNNQVMICFKQNTKYTPQMLRLERERRACMPKNSKLEREPHPAKPKEQRGKNRATSSSSHAQKLKHKRQIPPAMPKWPTLKARPYPNMPKVPKLKRERPPAMPTKTKRKRKHHPTMRNQPKHKRQFCTVSPKGPTLDRSHFIPFKSSQPSQVLPKRHPLLDQISFTKLYELFITTAFENAVAFL